MTTPEAGEGPAKITFDTWDAFLCVNGKLIATAQKSNKGKMDMLYALEKTVNSALQPLVARAEMASRMAEVIRHVASAYPKHFFEGKEQDPMGIHALLSDWDRVGKGDENGK